MQWFKNLMIYRLTRDIPLSASQIESQLQSLAYLPCGSLDMAKTGWISPLGNQSDVLAHEANGQVLLCARKEEKILPSSVIKQTLLNKVEKLEQLQQRKLKKTEKDSLKDEVIHDLLPRAFSRFSTNYLWLDTINKRVIVDAGSTKRAEDTLALLRKSLGSLPVMPLTLENPIELTLTEWVRSNHLPTSFSLQDEAELKALLEGGGTIRCKSQDLYCDEIIAHIEAGKVVTKLALDWRERIQFVLADDASLKKIKFSALLKEENADIDHADYAQRLDADFTLMTGELSLLITELIESLGGEKSGNE